MAILSHAHESPARISDRLHLVVSGLISDWEKFRRYRRIRQELESLSLKELDDIGVRPRDIAAVAFESVYGMTAN